MKIEITAFEIAERFVGIKEVPGSMSNPHILAMLKLDSTWPEGDDVPWCSAFVNYVCWLLRLPRSKSLLARSWLGVGVPIDISQAKIGFDIVVLKRSGKNQPGPENTTSPGHVGFFAGFDGSSVYVLGGNQGDSVNTSAYPKSQVLGIRALV